ncbi:hypothetical protein GCM10022254_56840 [Actinomadura meridiana]|uniref:Uncharacterized protein n=1 Tax=Actinomadura meridiana TaxID=559626 RepID=A0ABP8CG63_9ACTN
MDTPLGTRPLPPVTETEPVFVDATGGRARFGRRLGLAAGAVLVVFTGAVGIGLATGPNVPLTPWSEPSTRPSVRLSRPATPTERPDGRRAAASPEPARRPARTAPAAPPAKPSAADPAPPRTTTTPTRPGRSQASPPAWGRKKKNR